MKFKFDRDFQIELLALMSQEWDFLVFCSELVKPEYFEDQVLIWFYQTIINYLNDYGKGPTSTVIGNEIVKAYNAKIIKDDNKVHYLEVWDKLEKPVQASEYIKDELRYFCKRQAVKNAITGPIAGLMRSDKDGDWDQIIQLVSNACNVGDKDLDLGENYFKDYEERIKRYVEEDIVRVPTGITNLDILMGGGPKAGQLFMWMGGTGRGKSIGLSHCGKRAVIGGFKVLHYTMELSQDDICRRYDANWAKIPMNDLDSRNSDVVKSLFDWGKKYGNSLIVKEFPTKSASVNTLKRHTAQLVATGFKPDVIIVDYLDLLKPVTNYSDEYADLGSIAAELRGFAMEMKIPIFTATQVNRAGNTAEILDLTHMSDSIKKAFVADIIVAICMTREDKMENRARLVPIKNRNGPDFVEVPIVTDYSRMAFYVPGGIPTAEEPPPTLGVTK